MGLTNASFVAPDQESEIVTEGSAVVHSEPSQEGNVPPKVDSEAEVLDEKVSKQIIKEGHGSKPSKYSTCFCKYPLAFCWLDVDFSIALVGLLLLFIWIFLSDQFHIGHSALQGMDQKLAAQIWGYMAWAATYWIGSWKRYVASSNFSSLPRRLHIQALSQPPCLPLWLRWCIEQGKARSDMTVEERIGAADRRKMDGNSLFKEEKLEEAMQQYEMVMHLSLSLSLFPTITVKV